jgi:hypothetical protein
MKREYFVSIDDGKVLIPFKTSRQADEFADQIIYEGVVAVGKEGWTITPGIEGSRPVVAGGAWEEEPTAVDVVSLTRYANGTARLERLSQWDWDTGSWKLKGGETRWPGYAGRP